MRFWSPVGRDVMSMKGCMLEQKSQALCQPIEQTSERQELPAAQMERIRILQRDAREEFHKHIFQEIKDLEEQGLKEQ